MKCLTCKSPRPCNCPGVSYSESVEDTLTFARGYMGMPTTPHTQAIDLRIEQLMRIKQEALETMAVPMYFEPRSGSFASAALHQEIASQQMKASRRSGKTRAIEEAAALHAFDEVQRLSPPGTYGWEHVHLDATTEARLDPNGPGVSLRVEGKWTELMMGPVRQGVRAACAALIEARRDEKTARATVLRIETKLAQRALALKLQLDDDEDPALDAS